METGWSSVITNRQQNHMSRGASDEKNDDDGTEGTLIVAACDTRNRMDLSENIFDGKAPGKTEKSDLVVTSSSSSSSLSSVDCGVAKTGALSSAAALGHLINPQQRPPEEPDEIVRTNALSASTKKSLPVPIARDSLDLHRDFDYEQATECKGVAGPSRAENKSDAQQEEGQSDGSKKAGQIHSAVSVAILPKPTVPLSPTLGCTSQHIGAVSSAPAVLPQELAECATKSSCYIEAGSTSSAFLSAKGAIDQQRKNLLQFHCENRSNLGTSAQPNCPSVLIKASTAANPPINPSAKVRRGKWTSEEEAYVEQVIHDFNSGYLNCPAGTTLRTYLSEKLQCDPMRITKKFTGDACIGKRVFHPAVRSMTNSAAIDKAQAELEFLERKWRKRLEIQQKEYAKKAAASAAAAASTGRHHLSTGLMFTCPHTNIVLSTHHGLVARMAKWLDRASAVLDSAKPDFQCEDPGQSLQTSEVEFQLKEVEDLIYEGPKIQQTSAGLPKLLEGSPGLSPTSDVLTDATTTRVPLYTRPAGVQTGSKRKVFSDENQLDSETTAVTFDPTVQSQGCLPKAEDLSTGGGLEVPPKRKRSFQRSLSAESSSSSLSYSLAVDTKDAEALVGFLESVRSQNQTEHCASSSRRFSG